MTVTERRQWRCWCQVQEGVGEVVSCGDKNVGGGVVGNDGGYGEPCQGDGHAFSVGVPGPYPIASVVARGWPQLPTFYCAWGPCTTDFRFFVNECLGARRSKGRSIEFERTIRVGLGGELGVDARASDEIQGE
jgi:hypothetical protein